MNTTPSMLPRLSTAALYSVLAEMRSEDWFDPSISLVEHEISERLGAQLAAELGLDVAA